jgi:hypothetical protein
MTSGTCKHDRLVARTSPALGLAMTHVDLLKPLFPGISCDPGPAILLDSISIPAPEMVLTLAKLSVDLTHGG